MEQELRQTNNNSLEEVRSLLLQKDRLQAELKDWAATVESHTTLIHSLEEKMRLLGSEKRDFELLLTRQGRDAMV